MKAGERTFMLLLRLLPRQFRREATVELLEVFRAGHAKARRSGLATRMRFWARTIADLVATAVVEHWEIRRTKTRGDKRTNRQYKGGVLADVKLALRRMRRNPLHTVVSSLTLGVGIAATIVVATLIKQILIEPLPYANPEELVRLVEVDETGRQWWPSYPNLRDWRDNADFLPGVAGIGIPQPQPVIHGNQAAQVPIGRLMRGALRTLGVSPVIGRGFTPSENAPGGAPVALISHAFWRNTLNERTLDDITLTIGTDVYQVIGILPADFRIVGNGGVLTDAAVWLPMERFAGLGGRRSHGYHAIARLQPGTLAESQEAMNRLATRLRESHGEPTVAHTVLMTPFADYVVRDIERPLQLLFAGSLIVLLVAGFNLSTKILADGLSRSRELSVRLALGAHRGRLVRQLLTESAVLALPVTVIAVAVASGIVAYLRDSALGEIPRLESVQIDFSTLSGAAILTLLMAIAAGLIPAFALSVRNVADRLRSRGTAGTMHHRLWKLFVMAQVGLTLLLLFGSGLLIRSFEATLARPIGYETENVLTASVSLPISRYPDGPSRKRYLESALRRIRATPGVMAAGMTNVLPHETTARIAGTYRSGDASPDGMFLAGPRVVDIGIFATLGIPILQGEAATTENLSADQALIDASLAERMWEDRSPIGMRFENGMVGELSVAGVVGPIREWNYDMGAVGAFYVDYRSFDAPDLLSGMHLLIRTVNHPTDFINTFRATLNDIDALVPVSFEALSSQMNSTLSSRKLLLGVSSAFGIIGLLLATVGVYSIVAFTARQRQRDTGIRIALGAGGGRIHAETLRSGVTPVVAGIVAGGAALIPVSRALSSQIAGIGSLDPVTIALSVLVLLVTALLAADIPARRAIRLDPVSVLRSET